MRHSIASLEASKFAAEQLAWRVYHALVNASDEQAKNEARHGVRILRPASFSDAIDFCHKQQWRRVTNVLITARDEYEVARAAKMEGAR